MIVKSLPISETPASLEGLLGGGHSTLCEHIAFQSSNSNSETIYFGSKDSQDLELHIGQSTNLPVKSTSDIYFKGTSGDTINTIIFN